MFVSIKNLLFNDTACQSFLTVSIGIKRKSIFDFLTLFPLESFMCISFNFNEMYSIWNKNDFFKQCSYLR